MVVKLSQDISALRGIFHKYVEQQNTVEPRIAQSFIAKILTKDTP